MKKHYYLIAAMTVFAFLLLGAVATNINDFFLPGSQPGQSGNLESPDKCDNCHGGYDLAVEPAFNWRGSMMAQAQRDPLYLACLAIANQDAPESGDLCIRCHTPDGWLNGRSVPTDGSALNANDREGVQCDFCHKLVKPTPLGVNPYPDDADYLAHTYEDDQAYLANLTLIPPQSGNGMFIAHGANSKRGPYVDAAARHKMNYSPLHKESDICATCHDVSNPVYKRNADGSYSPNDFGAQAESFETYNMFPVERTYSEWKMSAYNTPEGVPSDVFGGNKSNVSTCQDCHMQDVSGYGCNKKGVPYRNDLPLHDFTGGNTFVPDLVAQLYPDEVNPAALEAGKLRARQMLQSAATVNLEVTQQSDGYKAVVEVINETGHKLPSGYPEGRRIWINIQAFDVDGILVYESGAYNQETAELDKNGTKIYEIKLGMTEAIAAAASADNSMVYVPGESFHFVLNNYVVKDNRIPPRGFTNENFETIQSPVVNYSYADGQHWDKTEYNLPAETFHVKARLLYQTISKEYADFLRDANITNDAGQTFYYLYEANGKSAPEVMNEVNYYDGVPPVEPIIVQNATLTRQSSAKGGKTFVVANLLITDEVSNPIQGANVSGVFSGPSSGAVSGVSSVDGFVELTSPSVKRVNGQWCLDITDISANGYEYLETVQICEPIQKGGVLSSSSIESNMQLVIYPNPTSDVINVKFNTASASVVSIDVYNVGGAKIRSLHSAEYSIGSNEVSFNIGDLPKGSYVLNINNNGTVEAKMFSVR